MLRFGRSAKAAEAELAARTEAAYEELGRRALEGVTPIAEIRWRDVVKVAGRVKALRVQPWAEAVASLELTLADDTGGITVVFLGRRSIGGVHLGARLVVEGRVSETRGHLALLNPAYQLLPPQVPLPY